LNVIGNDTDSRGNADLDPAITLVGAPAWVTSNVDGTITANPPSSVVGTIVFSYTVCDRNLSAICATAVVNLMIEAAPTILFAPTTQATVASSAAPTLPPTTVQVAPSTSPEIVLVGPSAVVQLAPTDLQGTEASRPTLAFTGNSGVTTQIVLGCALVGTGLVLTRSGRRRRSR
jgi:Bacterial Ig domain